MRPHSPALRIALLLVLACAARVRAQTIDVDVSRSGRAQVIEGFGTCLSGSEPEQDWWRELYFDDLAASILRFDLTPHFKAPYSDHGYNSPWFHDDPPLPGPDGNNVRTYHDAADYTRTWAGYSAKIAVLGPDIDKNVQLFDYDHEMPKAAGALAQIGKQKKGALGDFKLIASMWSPAPWLKQSSGHSVHGQHDPLPRDGAPWPFVWNAQFAGGVLDTSNTPRAEFDDAALGGSGPTSALTQYARTLAAYARGFQQRFGVKLYAVSLQNELGFEEFYGSCAYPRASDYIAVLKAARAELDRYDDLRAIRILGPEDVLGGDPHALWEVAGEGAGAVQPRSLQYLTEIARDPAALRALDTLCVHGYAIDGIQAAGGEPKMWDYWQHGWQSAPGAGLPSRVQGFADYHKTSWMTETSGEETAWLAPAGGYPSRGAFSIALKIHQALTAGGQSAWLYWQLSDGNPVATETLTDAKTLEQSPKYAAVRHFFRFIRPGAVRVNARVSGRDAVLASAYVHDRDGTLTLVLINTAADTLHATLHLPAIPAGIRTVQAWTSLDKTYQQESAHVVKNGAVQVPLPGYSVVTLQGRGKPIAATDIDHVAPLPAESVLSKLGKRAGCGCSMVAADVQTRRVRAGAIFAALIAGLHARRRRARTA
jgi:O-glycosyl hydrolase